MNVAWNSPQSFGWMPRREFHGPTTPRQALDASRAPLYDWFPDGVLNTCYNALDRHVAEGRGAQDALIYDSAMLGTQQRYSYAELTELVARFAGVLRRSGVGKGDRVVIYMPMIPEAAIAMLATARLGAVHSVVFGGFAPKELAARIRDAAPAAVVTASGGIEPSRRIEYLPAVAEALGTRRRPGHPGAGQDQGRLRLVRRRTPRAGSTGTPRWLPPSPPPRWTSRRRIRCTSSTPRAPPARRRAWCGTTAAMPWH